MYSYDAIGSYERSGYSVQARALTFPYAIIACTLHVVLCCFWRHAGAPAGLGLLQGRARCMLHGRSAGMQKTLCDRSHGGLQGSGKDLIQPVLDNQLKAASPLVLPPEVGRGLPLLLWSHRIADTFVLAPGGPEQQPGLSYIWPNMHACVELS